MSDFYKFYQKFLITEAKKPHPSKDGFTRISDPEIKNLTEKIDSTSTKYENIEVHDCDNLVSLEGLPQTIKGYLNISNCPKLKSLNGVPKNIGMYLTVAGCPGIKSLAGLGDVELTTDLNIGGLKENRFDTSAEEFSNLPKVKVINSNNSFLINVLEYFNFGKDIVPSTEDVPWPDSLIAVPYLGPKEDSYKKSSVEAVARFRQILEYAEKNSVGFKVPEELLSQRDTILDCLRTRPSYRGRGEEQGISPKVFNPRKAGKNNGATLVVRVGPDGKFTRNQNALNNGYDIVITVDVLNIKGGPLPKNEPTVDPSVDTPLDATLRWQRTPRRSLKEPRLDRKATF